MNKIIPLDPRYEFAFLEDEIKFAHPLSDYYLKLDDLSINLYISLKWINWGYYFLTSISNGLDEIREDHKIKDIISKGIQNLEEIEEFSKIILIDDKEVNKGELDITIREYTDGILGEFFHENTKIHMKLKINLREYLIISNMLYPTLIKWKEKWEEDK